MKPFANKWAAVLGIVIGAISIPAEEPVEANYTLTDEPAWVEPVGLDSDLLHAVPSSSHISDGISWLLNDYQVRLARPGETNAYYQHYGLQFLTEAGIKNQSTIQISFDPHYQRLELHRLQIWRNGSPLNCLHSADIRILQRELNLEWQMLDGRITLVILPQDLRVGDIIEAAYSLHGDNPVFEGKYCSALTMGWPMPMKKQFSRIRFPTDRPLRWCSYSDAPAPEIREEEGWREWRWDQTNLPPIPNEGNLPDWLRIYPMIELGELTTWEEVAEWAIRQYPSAPLPENIEPTLQSWRNLDTTKQQILAALDFVQDEIRYFAMELAAGSHRANPPSQVLQRRFGDCKDKALLLCSLLRDLGIEAYPALVHTSLRQELIREAPSPLAFNHAIVCIPHEGGYLWVDPTLSHQEGELDQRYRPPYGYALIVKPGTDQLTPIPDFQPETPDTQIEEHFKITGFDEPAILNVISRYSGRSAEIMRARLADISRTTLEQEFLNYYANRYPSIIQIQPASVEDIPESNQVVVCEQYQIDHLWQAGTPSASNLISAEFFAQEINLCSSWIQSAHRTQPLKIPYPIDIRQTMTVQLPEEWTIQSDRLAVENEAVSYRSSMTYANHVLVLDYHLQTLADAVAAEQAKAFMEDIERIRNDLFCTLTKDRRATASAGPPNWPVAGSTLMLFIFSCGIAIAIYRRQPVHREEILPTTSGPAGLGGWLILMGINLCIRPLILLKTLSDARVCLDLTSWQILTLPGSEQYHPSWAPALLVEIHSAIFLLVWTGLMLILFFQKRRSFPRLMILMLVLEGLVTLVSYSLSRSIPLLASAPLQTGIIIGIGIRLIWIAYLLQSQRVRNTFIH